MRRLSLIVAAGLLTVALGGPGRALAQGPPQPQPGAPTTVQPSISVDPDQPGATPHWQFTLAPTYCGGYRIGDGVYVSPEAPLALPSTVSSDAVLFAGQPASVDTATGALRVNPAPGLAQSMVCMTGPRALVVDVLPEAGLSLPNDPGQYAVDVWTGADPTPITLSFQVASPDDDADSG